MEKRKEYKREPFEYEGSDKVILSLNEPKTFTEIKKQTNLNPTTLNERLDHLFQTKYIRKIIDLSDRKPKYELTDSGREKLSSLTGTHKTEQFFASRLVERPIMEVIGEIADFYKKHPDKTKWLEEAKPEVIEPLTKLLFKIFQDLNIQMSKAQVKEFLEEGWRLIVKKWEEEKKMR
ncbi:MAG: transcriptional regulator [Candidatus Thermoplasmatota archaeon]|nr:transcriptional regulator [Candidatus Thermoplasmatota archaeon]